ncbi:MAG: outer membrane protein transport protein [Nitrospirota bacterium]|nr:outer membrane protein transport protein [Nitrospirota bacterium]MDP2383969.1 outer membrane protein transport protein [Nitrospirota bacterium]MDP3599106.1 outer membrane protein transport protein [Nitrospirota bacterium]
MNWILGSVVSMVVFLLPSYTFAQAIRFQPQGAAAAGQGNAFAAQADDASAIHFNPAGLTQLDGVQSMVGTNLMGGSIKYKSPAGLDTRGDFGGSITSPPPSQFYLSANLGALGLSALSPVTLGIGLTSPFGTSTRYPMNSPFNTAVTSATLPLIDIKPTFAYKVNDDLSLGVSADIYTFAGFLGEGHVEQRQVGAGLFGVPAGTSVEFNGKGTGAGATVSLLYTPLRNNEGKPIASIGLVYRTQAVVPLSGSLSVNGAKVADARTNLVLPQIYTGAIAVWPVRTNEREWKLELDVEYVGWKSNRDLDVHLSTGGVIPQPQQWKTVPVVAVGTEYKWLNPEWLPHWDVAVRSGYTRTENPVSDLTFNPGTISLSSNTLSIGAGFLCKGQGRFLGMVPCGGTSALWPKAMGLDVAFQEWFYEPRAVTSNQNPTVNGTYHAYVHLGTVSLKFMF